MSDKLKQLKIDLAKLESAQEMLDQVAKDHFHPGYWGVNKEWAITTELKKLIAELEDNQND